MKTEIPLVKVQEVPSHASTLQLFIQKMLQICRKYCTNHSAESLQSGKLSLKKKKTWWAKRRNKEYSKFSAQNRKTKVN